MVSGADLFSNLHSCSSRGRSRGSRALRSRRPQGPENQTKTRGRIYHFIFPKVCPANSLNPGKCDERPGRVQNKPSLPRRPGEPLGGDWPPARPDPGPPDTPPPGRPSRSTRPTRPTRSARSANGLNGPLLALNSAFKAGLVGDRNRDKSAGWPSTPSIYQSATIEVFGLWPPFVASCPHDGCTKLHGMPAQCLHKAACAPLVLVWLGPQTQTACMTVHFKEASPHNAFCEAACLEAAFLEAVL